MIISLITLISMEQEERYIELCKQLEKIIINIGEPLEGNCVYKHQSFEIWDCLKNKRINYQKIVTGRKNICEIGFNAGHSLLAMLLANQEAIYTLFDLEEHKYSKPCLEFIKSAFPNTKIVIYWGDSKITIPKYHSLNPKSVFDVIHIDGGHRYEVYSKDWSNSLGLISDDGIIIFDDTDNTKISNFIDGQIQHGTAKELGGYLETFGYQHRILCKKN